MMQKDRSTDAQALSRATLPPTDAPRRPREGGRRRALVSGQPWRRQSVGKFRFSYWCSSQSYIMTKGWSAFVRDRHRRHLPRRQEPLHRLPPMRRQSSTLSTGDTPTCASSGATTILHAHATANNEQTTRSGFHTSNTSGCSMKPLWRHKKRR